MSQMRLVLVPEKPPNQTPELPQPEVSPDGLGHAENEAPEEWRPVEGFEGYEVSNRGRLRLIKNIKSWVGSEGYAEVELWNANDRHRRGDHGTRKKLHVLIAKAFIPNPDNLPQVNHKDRNRANPDVDNLEWVTAKGNSEHSWAFPDRALTVPRGERHKMSKLTEHQVRCIRAFRGLWRQRSMARAFGVSQHNIMWVQTRKTWDHVK